MKRWMIVVAVVLVVTGAYAVWAQPGRNTDRGMMGGRMGRGMMQQEGEAGMACPMCGMMMGGMMQKTMVPTQDGGVIMAMGDKLVKYNSSLEKVEETTVEMDTQQMHQKMMQMMQNCPMMKQMQQGGRQEEQCARDVARLFGR